MTFISVASQNRKTPQQLHIYRRFYYNNTLHCWNMAQEKQRDHRSGRQYSLTVDRRQGEQSSQWP